MTALRRSCNEASSLDKSPSPYLKELDSDEIATPITPMAQAPKIDMTSPVLPQALNPQFDNEQGDDRINDMCSSPVPILSLKMRQNIEQQKEDEILSCLNGISLPVKSAFLAPSLCEGGEDEDEQVVDLWHLRELALSKGGLLSPTLRKRSWPKLVGIDGHVLLGLTAAGIAAHSLPSSYNMGGGLGCDIPMLIELTSDVIDTIKQDIRHGVWHVESHLKQQRLEKEQESLSWSKSNVSRCPTEAKIIKLATSRHQEDKEDSYVLVEKGTISPLSGASSFSNIRKPKANESRRLTPHSIPDSIQASSRVAPGGAASANAKNEDKSKYVIISSEVDSATPNAIFERGSTLKVAGGTPRAEYYLPASKRGSSTQEQKPTLGHSNINNDDCSAETETTNNTSFSSLKNQKGEKTKTKKKRRSTSVRSRGEEETLLNIMTSVLRCVPPPASQSHEVYEGATDGHKVIDCNGDESDCNSTSCVDRLHYYSGLQDITALILINLDSPSLTSLIMKRLSHTHLRDYMQSDFQKLQAALRVIFLPLLQIVDLELHDYLLKGGIDSSCDFCLNWILSWFGHNVLEVGVASRLMDVFLASHSSMPIYVSVAIVVMNRKNILSTDCDSDALSLVLSRLPQEMVRVIEMRKKKEKKTKCALELEGNGVNESSLDCFLENDESSSEYDIKTGIVIDMDGGADSLVNREERDYDLMDAFEKAIEMAIAYIKKVPPQKTIRVAQKYRNGTLSSSLAIARTGTILKPPSSWAVATTALTDWSLIKKAKALRLANLSRRPTIRRDNRHANAKNSNDEDSAATRKAIDSHLAKWSRMLASASMEKRYLKAVYASGLFQERITKVKCQRYWIKILIFLGILIVASTAFLLVAVDMKYPTARASVRGSQDDVLSLKKVRVSPFRKFKVGVAHFVSRGADADSIFSSMKGNDLAVPVGAKPVRSKEFGGFNAKVAESKVTKEGFAESEKTKNDGDSFSGHVSALKNVGVLFPFGGHITRTKDDDPQADKSKDVGVQHKDITTQLDSGNRGRGTAITEDKKEDNKPNGKNHNRKDFVLKRVLSTEMTKVKAFMRDALQENAEVVFF